MEFAAPVRIRAFESTAFYAELSLELLCLLQLRTNTV